MRGIWHWISAAPVPSECYIAEKGGQMFQFVRAGCLFLAGLLSLAVLIPAPPANAQDPTIDECLAQAEAAGLIQHGRANVVICPPPLAVMVEEEYIWYVVVWNQTGSLARVSVEILHYANPNQGVGNEAVSQGTMDFCPVASCRVWNVDVSSGEQVVYRHVFKPRAPDVYFTHVSGHITFPGTDETQYPVWIGVSQTHVRSR